MHHKVNRETGGGLLQPCIIKLIEKQEGIITTMHHKVNRETGGGLLQPCIIKLIEKQEGDYYNHAS